MIDISVVNWLMLEHGWTLDEAPGVIADLIHHARFLHEIYTAMDPSYTGRVTVPVLWDKHTGAIVITNRPRSCACSISSSERSMLTDRYVFKSFGRRGSAEVLTECCFLG